MIDIASGPWIPDDVFGPLEMASWLSSGLAVGTLTSWVSIVLVIVESKV